MAVLSQAQQRIIMRDVRQSTHVVYELSPGNDLVIWKWPLDAGGVKWVTPSDLRDHRLSHQFLGPRCLCAVGSGIQSGHKESAMYVAMSGRHAREYVASCATDECQYFVPLERIYKLNTPVKRYGLRRNGDPRPQDILHLSEKQLMLANTGSGAGGRLLKRTYALLNVNDVLLPEPEALAVPNGSPFQKLLQLDASTRPRLTVADFVALFARCECGMMVTKRAFLAHYCQSRQVDLIDLTKEN